MRVKVWKRSWIGRTQWNIWHIKQGRMKKHRTNKIRTHTKNNRPRLRDDYWDRNKAREFQNRKIHFELLPSEHIKFMRWVSIRVFMWIFFSCVCFNGSVICANNEWLRAQLICTCLIFFLLAKEKDTHTKQEQSENAQVIASQWRTNFAYSRCQKAEHITYS